MINNLKFILNKKYLNPSAYFNSINEIDFKFLKEKNIKKIIYDKDNTLCLHKDDKIEKSIESNFWKSIEIFGEDNISIVSNHKKFTSIYDTNKNKYDIIKTNKNKPDNYNEIIKNNLVNSKEILFIGDRLFTDILLANKNDCHSILLNPFSTSTEHIGIFLVRQIEYFLLKYHNINLSKNNKDILI